VTATDRLREIAAEYWEFHLREHPYVAHDLGDPRYRRELFHESAADHERRARAAAGFAARLAAIPAATLAGHDRYSHRLLARELEAIQGHLRFGTHLRPFLYPEGPDTTVAFTLQRSSIQTCLDAEDYVARLATLPAYFDDRRERLLAGAAAGHRLPAVLLDRICASVEAQLAAPDEQSAWYGPLARLTGAQPRFAEASAQLRQLIQRELRPAYGRWLEMLRGEYSAHCRESIGLREEPDGEACYAFLARGYTTVDATPAEIHATGVEEVARIRAAMEVVATRAGCSGDVAALQRQLIGSPGFVLASKESLRERVEVLAKRIERRIPEFFGRIPRMTYGIESIPEAQSAQLPPAYAQPNPPSRLSSGVFWVTGLPERCPVQMHVPLTLHEAWPGHLMHIALLQEMDELPAFRRYGMLGYTAYIEGWALYCEQLGHDFGLYEDPYAHYGQLEMELWRAVRLVVDTGIHAQGWSRPAALAYMGEHLTLPPATLEAEVDRYIGMPGQALAYKIGELKIRELRARAERALGVCFDLRALHDRMIDVGPVTLDLLEEHVQAWIDGAQERVA
jgi:uncharacterized protein (DUF885 family)